MEDMLGNKIVEDGKSFYLYKVKAAEGFYSISKKFGVSKKDIVDANPQCIDGVKLDMLLKIPVLEGRNASEVELKKADDFIYHKVEKGQSVFFISSQYNVSPEIIYENNAGSRSVLLENTEIKIPKSAIKKPSLETEQDTLHYVYHIVKPKESLYYLQQLYDVPVRTIIQENPGLENTVLSLGMQLRMPKKTKPVKAPQIKLLEDDNYFYHKVLPGETFLAISRKYNVLLADIYESNNMGENPVLPESTLLRIPKDKIQQEPMVASTDKYVIHRIEKKSNVEEVAAKFGVSENSIKGLNFYITDWDKLKKGTLVRIPIIQHVAKEVTNPSSVTRDSLNRYLALTSDAQLIKEALALGCDTIKRLDSLKVAFFIPLYLEKNDTINQYRNKDVDGNMQLKIKDVKSIFPSDPIFREFLNGALIAIDSLRKVGVNIDVTIFDTKSDTATVNKLLLNPSLKKVNMIIGPCSRGNIAPISSFCNKNKIKHILPLHSTEGLVENNNMLFQVNTPEKYRYKDMVDLMVAKFSGYNIVVIKQSSYNDIRQDTIANLIKQRLLKNQLAKGNGEELHYKEIIFEVHGQKGIETVLSSEIPNLIVIPSESKGAVNRVLPYIYGINSKADWDISLLGFPEWQKLDGKDYTYLFNIHTYLFSPFYANYNSAKVQHFLAKYNRWFGAEPSSGYPRFGFLGYDVMFYFGTQYVNFGADFERCMRFASIDLLQSNFRFKRSTNWGGFVNKDLYFLELTPSFDLKKLSGLE